MGHQANACKAPNKSLCQRCGSRDHERAECTATHPTCIHCKGRHEANDKECVERKRQINIRILMYGKNLAYKEVIEKYPEYASKNQFELLENLDEFPTLARSSYRDQLVGKKKKFVHGETRSRKIFSKKKPESFSRYYALHAHKESSSEPAPENKHRVNEVEREITKLSQEEKSFANKNSVCEANHSTKANKDKEPLTQSTQQEEQHNMTETTTSKSSSI